MTASEINDQIENIVATLRLPVTEEEGAGGWTAQSKEAALKYFVGLQHSLESGQPMPPPGIVRGLDHWGIIGGALLESIAKATNNIRRTHAAK